MLFLALLVLLISPDEDLAAKAEQAKQAMSAQDFDRAIALYRELNRAAPGNRAVQQNLGLALYSAGRYAESTSVLGQVLRADPGSAPALLFSGISWNRLDQPHRAVPLLTKFLAGSGEAAVARLELGHAHLELGKAREAVEDFLKACTLEPANPAAWKGLGMSYWTLAKDSFDWIESHAPFSPEWFALMARVDLQQEHYKRAFQLYRRAASSPRVVAGVHAGLAEIYRKTGHADWALVEERREQSTQTKEDSEVTRRYREVINDQQRAAEALDHLEKMPPGPEIHQLLGFAYRAQRRDAESATEFHRALEFEPNNTGLAREWAISLWLSGECRQAEPVIERLLRTNTNSPQLNHAMGDCLVQEKRSQDALPYLKAALKLNPAFLPSHASLGRAYLHLGRYLEAIPHLKEALALHDKPTLFQLAQAYKKIGDEANASRYLQEYKLYETESEQFLRLPEDVEITSP